MAIWLIILIIYGVITLIGFVLCMIIFFEEKNYLLFLIGILTVPVMILYACIELYEYLKKVMLDGGFRNHYQLVREEKQRKKEYDLNYMVTFLAVIGKSWCILRMNTMKC